MPWFVSRRRAHVQLDKRLQEEVVMKSKLNIWCDIIAVTGSPRTPHPPELPLHWLCTATCRAVQLGAVVTAAPWARGRCRG
jgi:hypothetical protein